jgi:hypothetical protein
LLRLQVDARHSGMKIVSDAYPTAKSFGSWSMAYPGPNSSLRGHLERLFLARPTSADGDRPTSMLRTLTS